jgi:uncharacterized protein
VRIYLRLRGKNCSASRLILIGKRAGSGSWKHFWPSGKLKYRKKKARSSSLGRSFAAWESSNIGSGGIEIIFKLENLDFFAELDNSLTASNIVKLLPMESVVAKWGEEIFFNIQKIQSNPENRTSRVNVGDVAFCPEGSCLCIFLGPTPASVMETPVPENPVVIIGRVITPRDKLKSIMPGERIKVLKASEGSSSSENKSAPEDEYATGRKLSQSEIDVLVKRLLEEKKRAAQ